MIFEENTTEQPNTFYIEEEEHRVKVVITFEDNRQCVDWPVQYMDGGFGWDFPERIPEQIKQAVYDRFTVLPENEREDKKTCYWCGQEFSPKSDSQAFCDEACAKAYV